MAGDHPAGSGIFRPGAGCLARPDGRVFGPATLARTPQRYLPPSAKPFAQVFRQAPAGRADFACDPRHAITGGRARREHRDLLLKHLTLRRHRPGAALDELEAHAYGLYSRADCPPAFEIL